MASDATISQPNTQGAWIHGRTSDLLIGCGLGYIVTLPVLLGFAHLFGGDWSRFFLIAFPIVFAMPHYGATLLRVYERRSERRKYAIFSVYLTAGLMALLFAALHDAWLASLCVTVYFTWSPWHFAGQNYGLSVMFLRRRGVDVPPLAKRLVYTSFVLSALLAIIALHAAGSNAVYSVQPDAQGAVYGLRGLRMGIPRDVAAMLAGVVGASYLGALGVGMALLRRAGASAADLTPALLLAATQSLWFVVPALADAVLGRHLAVLVFAPTWISAAHSCQYLWITSYYAKRDGDVPSRIPYLLRCVLAGSLLYTIPVLVLAPGRLGTIPYEGGLALLFFSVLNIHHFMLDGAIWKLRDGRIARALLQGRARSADLVISDPRRPWVRRVVWSAAAVCLALLVFAEYEGLYGIRGSYQDLARTQRAARYLDFVGRGSPKLHALIAHGLALQGDAAGAEREYRRSLAVMPERAEWGDLAAAAHYGLGRSLEVQQDWQAALDAYGLALEQRPDDLAALTRRADIHFRLEHGAKTPERAALHRERGIRELLRAHQLAPDNEPIDRELRKARERHGIVATPAAAPGDQAGAAPAPTRTAPRSTPDSA